MYLLGESRLSDGTPHAARMRARLMYDVVRDLEWSALIAQRAVDMEPGNATGQWYLASARKAQGRVDEAEAAYLEAMRDPALRQSSLSSLSALLLMKQEVARATRYVQTLNAEYPRDGWGWYYNLLLVIDRKGGKFELDDEEVDAAFRKFEENADPEDPGQQAQLRGWRDLRRSGAEMKARAEAEAEAEARKQADGP
jgi:predicted Zn-dependent protease